MRQYKQRVNDRLRNDESVRTLTEDEMARVHQIYLKMTRDIIDICMKNDVYLTLCGGSVLGAVRHQRRTMAQQLLGPHHAKADYNNIGICRSYS